MTRTEKENLVPVWERITISLEEAAAYSGIGVRKLRDMTDKPECNYVTISINFGIDKNEMKLLVIALAELDLTIDEWLCFR